MQAPIENLLHRYADRHDPQPEIATTGNRVITVRMPRELHSRLRDLAQINNTSINRLCCAVLEGVSLPADAEMPDQPPAA